MTDKNTKNPKKKHTLADRMKVYKKRFLKLDKNTQTKIAVSALIVVVVIAAALLALFGTGNDKLPTDNRNNNTVVIPEDYDPMADSKYEDEYTKLIREYTDVVIPKSAETDRNYFRETIFVGDSNTEALSVYGHLSLQYVMGVTGMPINSFTTNKCIWFVGNTEPVTMPQAIGMMKPRRIIINFGTNNAGGTTTENFIKMYKNSLEAVKKSYPYTDIIVASIFPIGQKRDYPNITMQDIDGFNIALAEMCRELGYKFLNTAEFFKNPDNGFIKDEYISSDGIHLNNDGYKAYIEYVNTHQYVIEDTRPARGNIPTRRNPPVATPSPSPTPKRSPTPAPSPSVSPSPSPSLSPSPSPSVAPTPTAVPTATPVPTLNPTATPVATRKPTATPAPTQKPAATPAPTQAPTPVVTEKPVVTPEPTAKPTERPTPEPTEAPKCGALGHSEEGKCPVCGSTYEKPKCGALGHSEEGKCPVCGSTYEKPKCGVLGHSEEGKCPVCGSTYEKPKPTCPDCGSEEHTKHPEEPKEEPKEEPGDSAED